MRSNNYFCHTNILITFNHFVQPESLKLHSYQIFINTHNTSKVLIIKMFFSILVVFFKIFFYQTWFYLDGELEILTGFFVLFLNILIWFARFHALTKIIMWIVFERVFFTENQYFFDIQFFFLSLESDLYVM